MSDIKLIQRIRDAAVALQQARERGDDEEVIEKLEDELLNLEEMLEEQQKYEYDSRHQHEWY